jgi:translation initiation factor 6
MASIVQTNFHGDPNLGIFGFATDKYFLIGPRINNLKKIESALGAKAIESTLFTTDLAGIFATGNSSGLVTSSAIEKEELENLKSHTNVLTLATKYTAIGNLILINDSGCLISKLLRDEKEKIEKFFGIGCKIFESPLGVVGSAALATNKGCVVHPRFGENEISQIEKTLKVECGTGTANFGSPFVGTSAMANSRGLLVSEQSTGIEVSRLEEILFGVGKD